MNAPSPELVASFCDAAQAHWRKAGSRRTPVRDVLCQVIGGQSLPFTAEELLVAARRVDRLISHATVYRTLGSLVEAGLLREMPGPRDQRCYATVRGDGTGVGNIVCSDCEQVFPLSDACLPLREGFLAKQMGFTPRKMTLRIEAACEELRTCGSCGRRKNAPTSAPR